jgi:hypothetical protein
MLHALAGVPRTPSARNPMSVPLLLLLAATAAPMAMPFEITSNKPFVQVTVDGSAPQWFILDTGNNGPSIVGRECADRLRLARGAEQRANIGAGSGADLGLATANRPILLHALGDTMTVAQPRVFPLEHVGKIEGRRLDGLIGRDFLSGHVVEIDYARRAITLRDPQAYEPPAGAIVVPLNLDTGWPMVAGTMTPPGGTPIPCRLIIDTGVRFTIALFRPFSTRNELYPSAGSLSNVVIGGGAGGVSRGDVARIDALTLGPATFAQPVAILSRDTAGVFSSENPADGIVGGELLRHHRVTFDYPHARMILEPYAGEFPFTYDMSGLFLAADAPAFNRIRVLSVAPGTPAAEAGLRTDDEIVAIDGRRTPTLTLDEARERFRSPVTRSLEVRRGDQTLQVRLAARRLV